MIDLSLPPYNLRNDGQDYTIPIHDALQAAIVGDGLIDYGQPNGDTLLFPKGRFITNRQVLPKGVCLLGSGKTATQLIMHPDLDPSVNFLEREYTGYAEFGATISNLSIWADANLPANYNTYAIATRGDQDTPILENVSIYAMQRGGFSGTEGTGGATFIEMRNVNVTTTKPAMPCFLFDYGDSTTVYASRIETCNNLKPDNPNRANEGYGMILKRGKFNIDGFHPEQTDTCILIAMPLAACQANIKNVTRGGINGTIISIASGEASRGRIRLRDIENGGSYGPTVADGRQNGQSIYGGIFQEITL